MAFAISSTGFPNGGDIPRKFTCDGADVSPELSWTEPPPGTQSFTLIADDPDAPSGTWTHWVLFDLPAATSSLAEGVTKIDELPGGERQGRNDFRKIGYNGPCPPPGKPHRYFFKLYALKGKLDLKPGASRQEVEQAMQVWCWARPSGWENTVAEHREAGAQQDASKNLTGVPTLASRRTPGQPSPRTARQLK